MVTEEPLVEEAPPSTKPVLEVVESTDNYGKIVVEPLERGFGVTLGNALRRVLLSALSGAAISWVRIEGVQHEYSTLPHLKEDVAELILNLKSVRIKAHSERPGPLRLEIQGPGEVCAGDIQPSADFDIVNPELFLASLDSEEGRLSVEFHVEIGKGYVPAAHTEGMPIGVLPVDAIYSPVTRVNYTVEKTRVGQVTDYDRLVLEVSTDGTWTAAEAVRGAGQILVDSFFQFVALGQDMEVAPDRQPLAHAIPADQYNMLIERLDLSARTLNCLKRAKVNKVGEVLERSHDELLKIKNFGDKSLNELYDRLRALGLLSQVEGSPAALAAASATAEGAPAEPQDVQDTRMSDAAPAGEEPEEAEAVSRSRAPIRDLSALRALLSDDDADQDAQEGGDGEPSPEDDAAS